MRVLFVSAVVLAAAAAAAAQHQHHHPSSAGERLGTVAFATSCSAAAQPLFNRAVALMHSFEFADAIRAFAEAQKADGSCAMSDWGYAMARWGNPFSVAQRVPKVLQEGAAAVARARARGVKTPREQAYLDAVAILYTDADTVDQRTRILGYRDAMGRLAAAYPDDPEAKIFHALAVAGSHPPADKSYAALLQAGAILEPLVEQYPDHPGLTHYIIHSYDVPPLADKALAAARRYAKIAPSAPHALHMPSHTFTRVGAWEDSIETNAASADVARKLGSTAEELHAMDYRAYAYLQTAQDGKAKAMVESLPEVQARFDPDAMGGAAPSSAGFFALAAIPARYALERGDWAAAAALKPLPSPYAYPEAQTWFAKGLGAARGKDAAAARAAIAELTKLRDQLAAKKEAYWAEQVEIQRRGLVAWLALAEGRQAEALAEMTAAADMEDKTEKAAVTPGPLAPARELLGEMLLQAQKPADALAAFERTLKKEPNRFRALHGAARAASLAGKPDVAQRHAATLLQVCERADAPARPELAAAKTLASAAR